MEIMGKPQLSSEIRRAIDRTILFLGGETAGRRSELVQILADWAALYSARFPKDDDREIRIAWIEAICDYWETRVKLERLFDVEEERQ